MDEAAVIGGLLFQAPEPLAAADVLETYLTSSTIDDSKLRAFGVEPVLAEALRRFLPREPAVIRLACARGAAWVLGYRSAQRVDSWELVASIPTTMELPAGIRRATAETLIALVTESQQSLRIAAPYVDASGLELLSDSIAAATARGVAVRGIRNAELAAGC